MIFVLIVRTEHKVIFMHCLNFKAYTSLKSLQKSYCSKLTGIALSGMGSISFQTRALLFFGIKDEKNP